MRKISIILVFSFFFSLLLALPVSALPTEVWVDDDGFYDGITFFNTINEGIDGVETGGTVHVAAGTYCENVNITKNISLLGSGSDITFIDGQNVSRAIYAEGLNSSVTIDGFTIQNGKGDNGGGICSIGSSPNITNCTFSSNTATNYGGAMYNNGSSPTVTNCNFSNNTASFLGGAIFNDWSTPTITNCDFFSNSTVHCGGGMFNKDSSPTVTNCTFSENIAYFGAGMYNSSSSPSITNCDFFSNITVHCGGGMYNSSSSPKVTNCTLTGNTAEYGGGMNNFDSSPAVTNCTFYDNISSYGGGMNNCSSSSPKVTNCTFYDNTASNSGGGIHNEISSSPKITNCIIWENTPDAVSNAGSSAPTITYSDVSGGYVGTGNIDEGPLFVDAANNDFRILSSSPCAESGTDTGAPEYGSVIDDVIGTLRPTGNNYDMGAYECVKIFKICGGWTILPWLGDCCTCLDEALTGLEGHIDYVYRWNSDIGEYEYSHYINEELGWQGDFNTFELVRGYWFHSNGDCIWRI